MLVIRAAHAVLVLSSWALACSQSSAQSHVAFGPFGFQPSRELPDFELFEEGFKARVPSADTLLFWEPTSAWKPQFVNAMEVQMNLTPRALNPSKFRLAQAGLGFEAYFPDGLALRCRSLTAPFLSWPGGSAGPNVPVPPSTWHLLSFDEAQPPILISFMGDKMSLKVSGRPGDWTIKSELDYHGWVRFLLPTGFEPVATSGVSSLGELCKRIEKLAGFWFRPAPKLLGLEAETVPGGVLARWRFDRPGALVPGVAHAARKGGYPLEVRSPLDVIQRAKPGGVRAFSKEKELEIFFPEAAILHGIPVRSGTAPLSSEPSDSPPGYFRIGMETLLGPTNPHARAAVQTAYDVLAKEARPTVEPMTNSPLPYDDRGRGYGALGLRSFLKFSLAERDSDLDCGWQGVDMVRWEPAWVTDSQRERTSAYLSLAGLLGNARDRVYAGMLYAGQLARTNTGSLQVLRPVLRDLFRSTPETAWGKVVASPIKVLSGPYPHVTRTKTVLSFAFSNPGKAQTLVLACRRRYEIVDLTNVMDYTWKENHLHVIGMAGKVTGIKLREVSSDSLPTAAPAPPYTETISK